MQLVPASENDKTTVIQRDIHPFLEVCLSGSKRLWYLVRHVYNKWGIVVVLDGVSVDQFVASLIDETVEDGHNAVVRLKYRVVSLDIDWTCLKPVLEAAKNEALQLAYTPPVDLLTSNSLSNSKRLYAPSPSQLVKSSRKRKRTSIPAIPAPNLHSKRPRTTSNTLPIQHTLNNANKVMTNLQNQLTRLDNDPPTNSLLCRTSTSSLPPQDLSDSAAIPESFLKSCSRFDMPIDAQLPDSMLSIGASDEGHDPNADPFPSLPTNKTRRTNFPALPTATSIQPEIFSNIPAPPIPAPAIQPAMHFAAALRRLANSKDEIQKAEPQTAPHLDAPLLTCDEQLSDLGLNGDNASDGLLFEQRNQDLGSSFADHAAHASMGCSLSGILRNLE